MPAIRRAYRRGSRAQICGVFGLLAAVLYVAFLAGAGCSGLDMRTSFVSELAARDQPWSTLFRLTDIGAGGLIAVLAVGMWLWLSPGRWTLIGCVALGVLGFATTAVGILPMDCAVTADQLCHRSEHTGRVSWVHQAHTVVSVVATTASLVALGALGWHLRRLRGWRPVGWFGLVILPPSCGLCLVMAIVGVGLNPQPPWVAHLGAYLGACQRAQLLLLAVWIAALAGALCHDASCRNRRRPPEVPPDGLAA